MKLITKKFVNPLLAIAFKEGVDFVGDTDYKAQEPKQLGPQEWEVLIEWDDGDDDDDYEVIHPQPQGPTPKQTVTPQRKQPTLQDYENRLSKMKPVTAQPAPDQEHSAEVIHFPVKPKNSNDNFITGEDPGPLPSPPSADTSSPFDEIEKDYPIESTFSPPPVYAPLEVPEVEPCGECLPCAQGGDCIKVINAACQAIVDRNNILKHL